MKLNNRGFTFVEILAVIAIIGILSGISIIGVSRYREYAKNKDYEALAKSSYNAMEEYMMANPYKKEVTLKTLDEGEFLSNRIDPATKNTNCEGSVIVKTTKTAGVMDDNTYTVYLCCTNYKKMYTYPDGEVKDIDDPSKCDITETGSDEATYKITYNLNGGTVTGNPDKYSKSMLPLTIKNPTRSGYTFDGWTGSNGTTPQKTVTLAEGSKEDKTYTANWKVNTNPSYTITLNNNGATKAGTASVKVQVGDTNLSKIIKPVKEVTISYVNNVGATVSGGDTKKAYTLDGWYSSTSNGSKVASNSDTPLLQKSISGYTDKNGKWSKKSNTTLYAQWANVTATLPKVTKTGYTCKWTTSGGERASGGTWTFSSANARTFTAVCTPNTYTLKYDKQGGTGTCNSITKKYGSTWGNLCKVEKSGYTFEGWYTGKNGTGRKIMKNSKVESNVKVYAYWSSYYMLRKNGIAYYYPTIKEAVDNAVSNADANNGGTIYLMKDVTDVSNVTIDKNIIININSSKELKKPQYAIIIGKGNVKITGGGDITSNDDILFINRGTLTINMSGSIKHTVTSSYERSTIVNNNNLIIDRANISSKIHAITTQNTSGVVAKTTIKGGTIKTSGKWCTLLVNYKANLEITGGTIENTNANTITIGNYAGNTTIRDGTIINSADGAWATIHTGPPLVNGGYDNNQCGELKIATAATIKSKIIANNKGAPEVNGTYYCVLATGNCKYKYGGKNIDYYNLKQGIKCKSAG